MVTGHRSRLRILRYKKVISGTAMGKPRSHMARKKPRIQPAIPDVPGATRRDSVRGLSKVCSFLAFKTDLRSRHSWVTASATPGKPIAQGNKRARNHQSRPSQSAHTKTRATKRSKIGAQIETGSLSVVAFVFCFFPLRHLWNTG